MAGTKSLFLQSTVGRVSMDEFGVTGSPEFKEINGQREFVSSRRRKINSGLTLVFLFQSILT
jgi:hypothetical protein